MIAEIPAGKVIFETPPRARDQIEVKTLPPYAFVAWLTGDVCDYAIGHDARIVGQQEHRA